MVAYQEAPSPPLTDALRRACADALHVRTAEGRWLVGGEAVLFVYDRLGYSALTWPLKIAPLSWVREPGYRWAASHRGWVSRVAFRQSETETNG